MLSIDLLDEDVEGKRTLVGVVVAELAVQDHLAVVVADWKRRKELMRKDCFSLLWKVRRYQGLIRN